MKAFLHLAKGTVDPAAYISVKQHLFNRMDAFAQGFRACGFQVHERDPHPGEVKPGDVYAIWNRRGAQEGIADRAEAAGGIVLVAENGYFGRDEGGSQYLAISSHGHNGSGKPLIEHRPERLARLGLDFKPWRSSGGHILVCPNRFIAPSWFLMPQDWVARTVERLRSLCPGREIRVRPHPGHWKRLAEHPAISLRRDGLAGAHACVVWSSSAAIHALLAGIPVICCAPWQICRAACETSLDAAEAPAMPERMPAFELLARSQFTLAEIREGLPFRSLAVRQEAAA